MMASVVYIGSLFWALLILWSFTFLLKNLFLLNSKLTHFLLVKCKYGLGIIRTNRICVKMVENHKIQLPQEVSSSLIQKKNYVEIYFGFFLPLICAKGFLLKSISSGYKKMFYRRQHISFLIPFFSLPFFYLYFYQPPTHIYVYILFIILQ